MNSDSIERISMDQVICATVLQLQIHAAWGSMHPLSVYTTRDSKPCEDPAIDTMPTYLRDHRTVHENSASFGIAARRGPGSASERSCCNLQEVEVLIRYKARLRRTRVLLS